MTNEYNDLFSPNSDFYKSREAAHNYTNLAPILEEKGMDTSFAVDPNFIPEPLDATEEVTDEVLVNEKNFQTVGRIMYAMDKEKRDRARESQKTLANIQRFSEPIAKPASVPISDVDFGRYALEQIGFFNYNIAQMGYDTLTMQKAEPYQRLAFYYGINAYDRLKNFTKAGTARFFKGVLSDPSTYFGLGALGLVTKQLAKKVGGKNVLLNLIKNAGVTGAVGGVEGGAYGAMDNYFRQEIGMEAGGQKEFNFDELLKAAGYSAAAGGVLGGSIPVLGALGKQAVDVAKRVEIDDSAMVGSGLPPIKIISKEEAHIKKTVKDKTKVKEVIDAVNRIKSNYNEADGWAKLELNTKDSSIKILNKDKITKPFNEIPYNFHTPPEGVSKEQHIANITNEIVKDIKQIKAQADAGDVNAQSILQNSNWYETMRERLRIEYGGLGDLFVDVLGATSAQTTVQQNYKNTIDILSRYSRGDFDTEINAYDKRKKEGGSFSARDIYVNGEPVFPMITNAAGKLYNTNSPAAVAAILDLFREVKTGKKPKTINFMSNLLGLSNQATIDVWAARYLRKKAGLPRIPPVAEQGVAGEMLKDSELGNLKTGSSFGFGQQVIENAANILKKEGIDIGTDLKPDALQAVLWFLEKDEWTQNGWTSKLGEGGSLDLEASFGGSPNPKRVEELRSIINKIDTPENVRLQAQEELDSLQAPVDRFMLGVSAQRPDKIPSNVEQAEMAASFDEVLRNDETVITYQANNSRGKFMGDPERSLNVEFVVRSNFNPKDITKRLIEIGKEKNQDSVFISKVVPENKSTGKERPGGEIYFDTRKDETFLDQVEAILKAKDIDGFTAITDNRSKDRVNVQVQTGEKIAGITGVRFQYIPEFDKSFDANNAAAKFDEMRELYFDVLVEIQKLTGVSQADVVKYDTKVFFKGDYDERLRETISKDAEEIQPGRTNDEELTETDKGI